MPSFEDYARAKRVQLGKSIEGVKKIYLDTKFWVDLCDVSLGKKSDTVLEQMELTCKELVTTNKAIFPISYRIFHEVLKQTDEKSLKKTACLIDQLSKGITILSENERFDDELRYFIHSQSNNGELFEPSVFVWNKMPYVLGRVNPDFEAFNPEENEEIQKRFFDHMWNISLSDMIDTMGMDAVRSWPKGDDISKELTLGKQKAVNENKTLHATYMSEIAGILDVNHERIREMLWYSFVQSQPDQGQDEEEKDKTDVQPFLNLIYNAFDQNKMKFLLPSWDVIAKLHAVIRWDTNRLYKANDLDDIGHSMTALPYFDYFFTERSFASLIKQIGYDTKYSCVVASSPKDVSRLLNILKASQ